MLFLVRVSNLTVTDVRSGKVNRIFKQNAKRIAATLEARGYVKTQAG